MTKSNSVIKNRVKWNLLRMAFLLVVVFGFFFDFVTLTLVNRNQSNLEKVRFLYRLGSNESPSISETAVYDSKVTFSRVLRVIY